MPMDGLKRRLSFRKKKKDKVPECSKPHQWQEDEKKVREGTCSFQVRYLGCVEVFESRGMQVCEEAVKTLKAQCKSKYQRAILYVSGDALRVVDEISKSMIVDQTIEKVSFCAPDRNHEKGFAYICRDGTTRRWMCHGFLAVKESRFWRSQTIKGERLSHAVGCAFSICLERKQKRDKESTSSVTVSYSQDRTTFERTGSFRQTTLTERLFDPQSAILAEPVPVKMVDNPYAVQRPHATTNMLFRQGSFRGFSKLQEASSPFKRTLSLRLNDLPSTLERQNAVDFNQLNAGLNNNEVIPEVPSPENEESISQMCQQLTQGLTALTDDPFASAPLQSSHSASVVKQHSVPATFHTQPVSIHHPTSPIYQKNPWASKTSPNHNVSSAFPKPVHFQGHHASPPTNPFLSSGTSVTTAAGGQTARSTTLVHENRSHSIDTSPASGWQTQPIKNTMAHQQTVQVNGGANSSWEPKPDWITSVTQTSVASQNQTKTMDKKGDVFDPFDVAWAAKSSLLNKQDVTPASSTSSNPFSSKTMMTYKVDL